MIKSEAVRTENISKSYDSVLALDNINLTVNQGEVFGLIGPDGAGKTTFFRILTTLLLPDLGTAVMMGYDVRKEYKKIRQIVGYMAGRFSLYQDLTVEENLSFYATVFGTTIKENYDLIKDIYQHIEPFKKRRAGKLSGGMKQKLALSCALIHKPQVLILDEPTTGVDAVSRKEFWEMLVRLQQKGITILVSTPYMDEAGLCNRVGLIQGGRILTVDTPESIVNQFDQSLWTALTKDMHRLMQDLKEYKNIRTVFLFGQNIHFTLQQKDDNGQDLYEFLSKRGHSQIRMEKIKPTIEDCFMELMAVQD